MTFIQDKCKNLKSKQQWITELHSIRESYRVFSNENYERKTKKEAIVSLATTLAKFGPPSSQRSRKYDYNSE